MMYAIYAADGKIECVLKGRVAPPPSQSVIPLNASEYNALLNNLAAWRVVGGKITPYTQPQAEQLADAIVVQKRIVTAACVSAMTGGFVSSALGSAHTYPATLTDQHNLSGSVVSSLLPNLPSGWTTSFWCMDSTGAWAFTPHTAAQIQQVGLDGKAWITAQQEKLASLNAQIEVATTVSEVTAIIW